MGKRKSVKSGQGSEVIVEGLAEASTEALKAQERELRKRVTATNREQKKIDQANERLARHDHFVPGSVRRPTDEDRATFGERKIHGLVALVACTYEGCDNTRLVNTQDVFQAKFCDEHRKRRGSGKGLSAEELQERIAKLQAQLAEAEAA